MKNTIEDCIEWLKNNYQDYKNIADLCDGMREAMNENAELQILQEKAACYDWLLSGELVRQGVRVAGYREIMKNNMTALMTFQYWGSPAQIHAEINSVRVHGPDWRNK